MSVPMEADNSLGFADYFAAVKRRRKLMALVALPVIVIAGIIALALPDIFIAPAEFQFEQSALAEIEGARNNRDEYEDEFVTKLTELVTTGQNLKRMKDELKLDTDSEDIRSNIDVEMVTQRILDPQSGRQKDVNAGFSVSYRSPTAEEAQKVSHWLAASFVSANRQNRHDRIEHTVTFLESEAERYRVQIAALQSKVATFKSHHIGELPESAQATMAFRDRADQEINDVQLQIRTLEQNRIFMESQLQQAQVAPDNDTIRELEDEYRRKSVNYDPSHPDLLALRKQIDAARRMGSTRGDTSLAAQLETQKAILTQTRQRYSEDHPDVRRIERQIATLESRIAAGEKSDSSTAAPMDPIVVQLKTQLRSTDNQLASLQIRLAELRGKSAQLTGQIGSSPQVEKEYQTLMRDLGLATDKYDQMLKQRMDAEFSAAATLAGSGDEFRLSRQPGLPNAAAKPSRIAIAIIGGILGFVLAVLAGLGAEAFDQTVRGSRDVLSTLGLSPLAVIPDIKNSISGARRYRQLRSLAVSVIVGIPALWFLIHFLVR